jgi:hypothetical protein
VVPDAAERSGVFVADCSAVDAAARLKNRTRVDQTGDTVCSHLIEDTSWKLD